MNKGDLVQKLRERGLSRRRAVQILNFVLDEMAAALERGEEVKLPFGTLQKVRHAHQKQRGRFLNRIATIYQKPYTVVLAVAAEDEEVLEGKEKSQVAGAAAARTRGLPVAITLPVRPRPKV
jgi:nucleoid DNA-binding protein